MKSDNIGKINYVGLAKAAVRANKGKMDLSVCKEGEKFDAFVNRVYNNAIWRMICAISITDTVIYKIDDRLREVHPEYDELRASMLDYYEKFSARVQEIINAEEDVILDFKFHFGKRSGRKVNSFMKRAVAVCKKLDVNDHETIALLCVFLKMCDTIKDLYTESIKPLGVIAKHLPDFVPRAMFFMDWSEKKALRIIESLDPMDRETSQPDPKLDSLYNDLIDLMLDYSAQVKSIKFARKENGQK